MSDLNWALRETGASIVGVSSESVREEGCVSNLLDSNNDTHWVAGTAPQYVIVKLANKHPSLHYVGWDVSQHTTNNIKTIEIAVANSTDLQEQLNEQLIFAHKMKVIMRCEAIPGAGVQLWRLPEPITEDKEYIRFTILSTFDNGAVRLNNLYLLEHESSLADNYSTPIGETLNAKSNIPGLGNNKCDERVNRENVTTLPSSNSKQANNAANSEGKAVLPFTPSLASSREQSYLNKSNCSQESAQIAATLPSVTFPRKEELEQEQQQSKSSGKDIDNMIRQDKSAQVNFDNNTNISDACVLQQEYTNEKKEETFAQETKPTEPHVPSQTGTSQNNTTMPHRSPSSRVQQLLKDLNDDICMLKPIKIISPRRNLLHYLPDNLPEELDNFELGAEHELDNYHNGEFIGSELFSRANMQRSPAHNGEPQEQEQYQRQLANQRKQKQTTNQFNNNQRNNSRHSNTNNILHSNKMNNMGKTKNNNNKDKARNSEDEEHKRKTENTHSYLRKEKNNDNSDNNELENKEKRQHKKHIHRHRSRRLQRRQSNEIAPDNKSIADNTTVMYMKRIEHLERVVASLTTVVQQQREDLSIIKQALVRQCLQNRHDQCNNINKNSSTDHATKKINEESSYNAHHNNNNHAYTKTKPSFESCILAPVAANSINDNSNHCVNTKYDRENIENFTLLTEKEDEQEERTCMLLEHADQQEKSGKEETNAKRLAEHEHNSELRHYVRSILNKYLRKEAKKLEFASFAKIDDHLHDIIQRISNATNYDANNLKSSNHINVKIETFPSPSSISGKVEETPPLKHHTPQSVKTEEREQHEYIPVYFKTIPSMQEQDTEKQGEQLYM